MGGDHSFESQPLAGSWRKKMPQSAGVWRMKLSSTRWLWPFQKCSTVPATRLPSTRHSCSGSLKEDRANFLHCARHVRDAPSRISFPPISVDHWSKEKRGGGTQHGPSKKKSKQKNKINKTQIKQIEAKKNALHVYTLFCCRGENIFFTFSGGSFTAQLYLDVL